MNIFLLVVKDSTCKQTQERVTSWYGKYSYPDLFERCVLCATVKVSWVYLPGYKTPYVLDDCGIKLKKKKEMGKHYRYASLNDGNTLREMCR